VRSIRLEVEEAHLALGCPSGHQTERIGDFNRLKNSNAPNGILLC
jgi:hypothetical protein